MKRKEFLSTLGFTAVSVLCAQCLGGCQSPTDFAGPTNIDFTLDLTASANHDLTLTGGSLYKSGIIIAHTNAGAYVAVSSTCTHAGSTVAFDAAGNLFHCPSHGSNFALDGSVINGPAGSPLTRYKTSLSGTSLRVYS
jgi:cytochrome b6-f complex iron-sulfur subunit